MRLKHGPDQAIFFCLIGLDLDLYTSPLNSTESMLELGLRLEITRVRAS